jgi:hypothetical protein
MAGIRENSTTIYNEMGDVQEPKRPLALKKTGEPKTPDQDLIYTQSIGVTTAARELEEQKVGETCPPEVYIG